MVSHPSNLWPKLDAMSRVPGGTRGLYKLVIYNWSSNLLTNWDEAPSKIKGKSTNHQIWFNMI